MDITGTFAAEADEEEVSQLTTIWDDKYVESVGMNSWRCLRCNKLFKPKHATRAVAHMAKEKNLGIAVCSASTPKEHSQRYTDLFHRTVNKAINRKRGQETVLNVAEARQDVAAFSLCEKKLKTTLVQSSLFSSPLASGSVSTASSMAAKPRSPQRWLQSSLNGLVDQMVQSDVRTISNAKLEMAIADFWHSDNLPDRAVESPRFKLILKYAKLVDQTFKVPSRKSIGGPLLDLNYKNFMTLNKEMILKEADVFGLAWLSDGATVARMPLMNVLAMCANISPTTVAITDCSEHISHGGKKDAPFIASMMEDLVLKFDPTKSHTDIFFFDGASNVAKAGQVLQAKFLCSYSLHGGEHVVSLFFDDISKLPPIKVSVVFHFYAFLLIECDLTF